VVCFSSVEATAVNVQTPDELMSKTPAIGRVPSGRTLVSGYLMAFYSMAFDDAVLNKERALDSTPDRGGLNS
jgi:hypothetical protein